MSTILRDIAGAEIRQKSAHEESAVRIDAVETSASIDEDDVNASREELLSRRGEFPTPEDDDGCIAEIPTDIFPAPPPADVAPDVASEATLSPKGRNLDTSAAYPSELGLLDIEEPSDHMNHIVGGQKMDIIDDLLQEPSLPADGESNRKLNTETSHREGICDEVQRVCSEVIMEFPDACSDLRPFLYIIKYMVQNARNISSGSMRISNFLRIFWLIHRADYPCRMGNFYKYYKGAWVIRGEKKYDTYHFTEITQARGGIFVSLSRGKVEYDWASVDAQIRCMDLRGLAIWQALALVSADNGSSSTGGKRYKAHWCAKFADKLRQAKHFFEGDTSKMWKRLAVSVETPQPRSRGIQFGDVYITDENDAYAEAPSSTRNDCYVYLPYRLKVGSAEFTNSSYIRTYGASRWSERDHLDMLKEYLKRHFGGVWGYFLVKCASLKMALKKNAPTDGIFAKGPVPTGMEVTIF